MTSTPPGPPELPPPVSGPPPYPPPYPPVSPGYPPYPGYGQYPPGAGGAWQGYGGPPGEGAPKKGTSGLSIAALVVGICGCLVLTIPVAIVLAVVALVRSGGRTATRVLAIVGLVMAVLWAGAWAVGVVFALSLGNACTSPKSGYATVCTLKPGDCFQNPSDTADLIASVKLSECTEPHNAQAIGAFTEHASSWPGTDGYASDAETECKTIVDENVDTGKVASTDTLGYLAPDSNAWNAGHHNVICIVFTDGSWSSSILKPDADLSVPTN